MSRGFVTTAMRFAFVAFVVPASMSTMTTGAIAAACNVNALNGTTITVSPALNVTAYNPFLAGASQTVTVTLTRNNTGNNGACELGVYYQGARTTKTLAQGGQALNYDVKFGGASVLVASGGSVGSTAVVSINRNQTQSVALTFEVAANQLVPAATYTDLLATVAVARINPGNQTVGSPKFGPGAPQATVVKACRLGTPSATALAFAAADIPKGLPNEGVQKSSQMAGDCTAPTRVRLTGQALQPVSPTGPRPNFDNFINYQASASFGSATTTLTTTTTSQNVDSAGYSSGIGTTSSGNVGVTVSLKKGQPVIAGNYSGILTVTLDPNL